MIAALSSSRSASDVSVDCRLAPDQYQYANPMIATMITHLAMRDSVDRYCGQCSARTGIGLSWSGHDRPHRRRAQALPVLGCPHVDASFLCRTADSRRDGPGRRRTRPSAIRHARPTGQSSRRDRRVQGFCRGNPSPRTRGGRGPRLADPLARTRLEADRLSDGAYFHRLRHAWVVLRWPHDGPAFRIRRRRSVPAGGRAVQIQPADSPGRVPRRCLGRRRGRRRIRVARQQVQGSDACPSRN